MGLGLGGRSEVATRFLAAHQRGAMTFARRAMQVLTQLQPQSKSVVIQEMMEDSLSHAWETVQSF